MPNRSLDQLGAARLTDFSVLAAYAGLFVSALSAATLLPGSSEAVLLAMMAAKGGSPLALFIVATIGNVVGSAINYALGRAVERLRDRPWFPISQKQYEAACRNFARFGTWSLLFAWAPFVGDPLTVAAGALRVPFALFLLLVTIGKAARYLTIMGGGFWWFGGS